MSTLFFCCLQLSSVGESIDFVGKISRLNKSYWESENKLQLPAFGKESVLQHFDFIAAKIVNFHILNFLSLVATALHFFPTLNGMNIFNITSSFSSTVLHNNFSKRSLEAAAAARKRMQLNEQKKHSVTSCCAPSNLRMKLKRNSCYNSEAHFSFFTSTGVFLCTYEWSAYVKKSRFEAWNERRQIMHGFMVTEQYEYAMISRKKCDCNRYDFYFWWGLHAKAFRRRILEHVLWCGNWKWI